MQISINIPEALKHHLTKKFPSGSIPEEVYEFFFTSGVLDKKNVLRMLVKSRFYDLLKTNSSARSARLDCAIEFGVSETFVTDTIYHYTNIKP